MSSYKKKNLKIGVRELYAGTVQAPLNSRLKMRRRELQKHCAVTVRGVDLISQLCILISVCTKGESVCVFVCEEERGGGESAKLGAKVFIPFKHVI